VRYVDSQGAEHIINWELASAPECRQLTSKFKLIEQYLEPPYVVEVKPQAKKGADEARRAEEKTGKRPREGCNLVNDSDDMRSRMLPLRELFDYVWNRARRAYHSAL
jgi:DNA gyrase subunit B